MAFPQIETSLGSLIITALLWFWTIKRARVNLFQQESILRQQNRAASWSFALCMIIQALTLMTDSLIFSLSIALACSFVFCLFIFTSYRKGSGFLAKKRNQILAGILVCAGLCLLALILEDVCFVPVMTALIIANICQRRFVKLFSNSLRDLEALQAKLMKQDANLHNLRQKDTKVTIHTSYTHQENQAESMA